MQVVGQYNQYRLQTPLQKNDRFERWYAQSLQQTHVLLTLYKGLAAKEKRWLAQRGAQLVSIRDGLARAHCVEIIDFGEQNQHFFVVTRYFDRQIPLQVEQLLPPNELLTFLEQIGKAFDVLHQAGLLHYQPDPQCFFNMPGVGGESRWYLDALLSPIIRNSYQTKTEEIAQFAYLWLNLFFNRQTTAPAPYQPFITLLQDAAGGQVRNFGKDWQTRIEALKRYNPRQGTLSTRYPYLEVGTVIGEYTILRELAQGGFGIVYLVQGRNQFPVVLKIMRAERMRDEQLRRRFEHEIATLKRLPPYPHIVQFITAGEYLYHGVQVRYFVMSLVKGETLRQYIEQRKTEQPTPPFLEPSRFRTFFEQVAGAVAHLHQAQVLHRDLNPRNIMYDGQNFCLVDLGASKDMHLSTVTNAPNEIPRTPGYVAPELVRGEYPDHRADQYSLAATFIDLLNGLGTVAQQVRWWEIMPYLSPALRDVLWRALQPTPQDRYPNTVEFLQAALAACPNPQRLGSQPKLPTPNHNQIGKYRKVEAIGKGGMGEVYIVENPQKQRYALKILQVHLLNNPKALELFESEMEVLYDLAKLKNPSIVKIHDHGKDEAGRPYFVMDYIAGRDLHQRVFKDQKVLAPKEALQMLNQINNVLHAMHMGVQRTVTLHRDLKPANIMESVQGATVQYYLMDFGIAGGGEFMGGTGPYMAPEGHGAPTAEVYSMGVTLFEVLMGVRFAPPQKDLLLVQFRHHHPVLVTVIEKALATNPTERYKDMAQLYEAFSEVVAVATPTNKKMTVSYPSLTTKRQRVSWRTLFPRLVLAGLLILLFVFVLAFVPYARDILCSLGYC